MGSIEAKSGSTYVKHTIGNVKPIGCTLKEDQPMRSSNCIKFLKKHDKNVARIHCTKSTNCQQSGTCNEI